MLDLSDQPVLFVLSNLQSPNLITPSSEILVLSESNLAVN